MADSKTSILITLVHEGGFQKDPEDSGNWTGGKIGRGELNGTKYGISAEEFPDLDIENLTTDQATAIYQEKYWKSHYSEIQTQSVADGLFDLGVLMGVGTVIEILQRVLNISIDGVFGPDTVAHVNGAESVSLLAAYKAALVSHAIGVANAKPEDREDLPGWIRRINHPNCGFKH